MITKAQAESLKVGTIIYHTSHKNTDGSALRFKINGKCKTWKRSPERFQVPIEHALFTFGYLTETNAHEFTLEDPSKSAVLPDVAELCPDCGGTGESTLMGVRVNCYTCHPTATPPSTPTSNRQLEVLVHKAMDNAVANGFPQMMKGYTAILVAEDLIAYDSKLESYNPGDLLPHIDSWRTKQKSLESQTSTPKSIINPNTRSKFVFRGSTYIVKTNDGLNFYYRDEAHLGGPWTCDGTALLNKSYDSGFRNLLFATIEDIKLKFPYDQFVKEGTVPDTLSVVSDSTPVPPMVDDIVLPNAPEPAVGRLPSKEESPILPILSIGTSELDRDTILEVLRNKNTDYVEEAGIDDLRMTVQELQEELWSLRTTEQLEEEMESLLEDREDSYIGELPATEDFDSHGL